MLAGNSFIAPPGIPSYAHDQWPQQQTQQYQQPQQQPQQPQQQQQKNMSANGWHQPTYQVSNGPMSAHAAPVFYDPFAQHQQSPRAHSFALSPDSYASPWHHRSSYPFPSNFGNVAPHPNAYLTPHYGHENSQIHVDHQMRGYANKQNFHQGAGSQWLAPLKTNLVFAGASTMSSPFKTSNGSGSPLAFRNGSIQRVDSVVEVTAPRGPPRKPKQSGFALWVGNLPFGASIVDLKDHFSLDAKEDIESLCLLASSSCAFVNYKSEEACIAAHQRFNGSRFGPVRLLCRVRNGKDQKESTRGLPPSRLQPGLQPTTQPEDEIVHGLAELKIDEKQEVGSQVTKSDTPSEKLGDRYFVLKSLTLRDLQVSLQKGHWETQQHNRAILDSAFDTSDSVYLIFSVNKSGEYFGYARMSSRSFQQGIVGEEAKASEVDHNAGLIITPTNATETAPKGRIVEDAVRGTLFWEIDGDALTSDEIASTDAAEDSPNRHFKVQWESVQCVPFRRTKGLRNAWNENKEVKVARDGTELETEVGRQLVALFQGAANGVRS